MGVPDVYALRAVYESNGTNSLDNTDALPPMLTVASGLVGVSPGDKITGSVSGAVGRIIESKSSNTNLYFYYISETEFTTSDIITNENSTDSATNSRQCTAITTESKDITYTKPNLNNEWDEAERYEEFKKIGKDKWIDLVKKGNVVEYNTKTVQKMSNTDAVNVKDFDNLDKNKQQRALKQLETGSIELPIVASYSD